MIQFFPQPNQEKTTLSILIASWNNLPYLRCCVESIKKNSRYAHTILIHLNEATDGSRAYVEENKLAYSYSSENVGVCHAFNAAAALAETDNILLSDDDFYFPPDWDVPLMEELQKMTNDYFCLSGTMIEPEVSPFACMLTPYDYGRSPQEFQEKKFIAEYASLPYRDWSGSGWYPLVMRRSIWNLIGGLSVEFFPGAGSDPDMMMKLWHAGVRYCKGLSAFRVYHFRSKSTRRIKLNNGHQQFLQKWKINISTFFTYYLRMGQPFAGQLAEPTVPIFVRWKDRFKRWWACL